MDIRLNQAVRGLNQADSSSVSTNEAKGKKTAGLDFEEILLEKTSNNQKELIPILTSSTAKIFEDMADTWLAYQDELDSSDSNRAESFFGDEYSFDRESDELERLEGLVKGSGYYSVDSVIGRLFGMIKDVAGIKNISLFSDVPTAALKEAEKNAGELPDAVYEAAEAVSYKLRKS